MGDQSLLILISLKVLVMITSLQNIVFSVFRCSEPPDVDGIKIFDKND